jgi:hypothetical protein
MTLADLDPAVALLLLLEYPVRRAIARRLLRMKEGGIDVSAMWKPTFRDVEGIIALKPWRGSPGVVPWQQMVDDGVATGFYPYAFVLEPLCLDEFQPIRNWYMNSLFNYAPRHPVDRVNDYLPAGMEWNWRTLLQMNYDRVGKDWRNQN